MSFKRPHQPVLEEKQDVGTQVVQKKEEEKEAPFSLFANLGGSLVKPPAHVSVAAKIAAEMLLGKSVEKVQQELDQRAESEKASANLLRRLK